MEYNSAMTSRESSDRQEVSRRDALRLGAFGAGALAFSRLPPSLRRVIATAPPTGGLDQIEHVVLLMQENRSFDHYFGTLSGVRGFGDRTVLRTRTGGSMFEQPHPDGSAVLPFSVRDAAARQQRDLQYIGELAHGWEDGLGAWARGWNDSWIPNKGPATMAHYDRADIPLQFELADTFTICDAYHCSVKSSTSPNRNYFVSGTTGFEPGTTTRAVTNAAYDELNHAGYDWLTYPELLESAGVTWKVYQEWDNFGDNNLEFFASFKAVMQAALAPIDGGKHTTASGFYGSLFALHEPEQNLLLAALDEAVAALPDDQRSLFERGVRRSPLGTLAEQFAADVTAGTLPTVSYLVPSAADSEHPGSSSPIQSARVIYDVLDALASHPDVWARTALLITYDENDGFYDHVPPPAPPPDTPDEFEGDMPIGLGVRVPMIVVSPWSVGGWVCSETFDHTSIVQFLELVTGVQTDQITPWRRQVAGDLSSTFDFESASAPPGPADPGPVPQFTERWAPEPPADQALAPQEPGTKPARALPYQPDAWGHVDGDVLRITLSNHGERPAHLVVYDWTAGLAEPVHVDVVDEATVDVPLAEGLYDVSVAGPNRFLREFAGAGELADVSSAIGEEKRDLAVTVVNRGESPLDVSVAALAYGNAAGGATIEPGAESAHVWSTESADGWYDVEITLAGSTTFRRRLTGHIENGEPSITG